MEFRKLPPQSGAIGSYRDPDCKPKFEPNSFPLVPLVSKHRVGNSGEWTLFHGSSTLAARLFELAKILTAAVARCRAPCPGHFLRCFATQERTSVFAVTIWDGVMRLATVSRNAALRCRCSPGGYVDAARSNHLYASTSSCATPRPRWYMAPRLF